MAELWEFAAVFRLVAVEAILGERRYVALRGVDVVAGGAGHGTGAEAAASLEKGDLIAVDVYGLVRVVGDEEEFFYVVTGDKGQGRGDGLGCSGVA